MHGACRCAPLLHDAGSGIASRCAVTQDSAAPTHVPEGLPIAPGQLIGERYLVGQVLGGGGMGVVFQGTHVLLGTPVAVKLNIRHGWPTLTTRSK